MRLIKLQGGFSCCVCAIITLGKSVELLQIHSFAGGIACIAVSMMAIISSVYYMSKQNAKQKTNNTKQ